MRFVYYYIIILFLFCSCYSKESLREQVVSLYEQGKQWEEAKQADSAVAFYLRSFKLAKELKEDSLSGKIGNVLGDIMSMQNFCNQAILVHQEAYKYSINMKDKTAASYSLRGIGKAYMFNMTEDSTLYRMRLDSARKYFNCAKGLISQVRSQEEISLIYNNLCVYYMTINDFSKALEYNHKAISFTKDSITLYKNYFCRSNIFYSFSQYDSVIYYCKKAMRSSYLYTQYSGCYQLATTLAKMGLPDSAMYFRKAYEIHDKIEKQKYESEIMQLYQSDIHATLETEKRIAVICIVFILSILSFVGFILYRRHIRHRLLLQKYVMYLMQRELVDKKEQTYNLRRELEESKQIINYGELKEQKRREEERIVFQIIRLGEECVMCFQKDLFFKNIVGKLNEESTFANAERQVLIRKINQYFMLYIQEISRYFQLADEDYFICCLTLLGFSTKHCAIFRGVGEAAIRVQRRRIKEKLKGFFHSEKLYNSIFGKKKYSM